MTRVIKIHFILLFALWPLFRAASQGISLPATIAYLEAVERNGKVMIHWSTLMEEGLRNFRIERSLDGREYFELGRIEGNKYANEEVSYEFIDELPMEGFNHYLLVAEDLNGNEMLFGQVTAKVKEIEPQIMALSRDRMLEINSTRPITRIELVDNDGNSVGIRKINDFNFVVEDLPPGKYAIQSECESGKSSRLKVRHN